jgi:hypothetical protein
VVDVEGGYLLALFTVFDWFDPLRFGNQSAGDVIVFLVSSDMFLVCGVERYGGKLDDDLVCSVFDARTRSHVLQETVYHSLALQPGCVRADCLATNTEYCDRCTHAATQATSVARIKTEGTKGLLTVSGVRVRVRWKCEGLQTFCKTCG